MKYLQLLTGDSHHRIIFGIEARTFQSDRQGDMIGAADAARQGDLFAFKIIERFVLRGRLQLVRNAIGGKPNRPRRQTGERRCNGCRADAGDVIDVALIHGGGAEGRAHDDDLNVETILSKGAPIARCQQRQGRDRQAGVGDAHLGAFVLAGGRESDDNNYEQCKQNLPD